MTSLPGTGKLVLVVEDDFPIRDTLKEALESDGYSVLTAQNGKEGLDILLGGSRPDLVLLDMMMPVMSGREFLDRVSTDCVLAPIPILVVSANADEKNTYGARAFIKKPPDLEVLLKMVAGFVSSKD